MSPPPAKRRRTSSPRPLLSPQTAGSPPPRPSRRPASPPVQPRNGRRHPLDGFNDEGDSGEEAEGVTGTGSTRTSSDMDHQPQSHEEEEEEEEEHCAICLSPIENRAVVSPCHHGQFCWGCIRAWTDQSRKCPLCLGPIEHLIHNIRSAKDYQNHYLLPLPTASSSSDFVATFPPPPAARGGSFARSRPGAATMNPTLPRHALYGRQSRTSRFSSSNRVDERDEATWREREQERALERRRYIYREGLYAKHVASNRYTGFKPFSPHTFSRNEELKAKVIKFIRRELQVFPAVDVAFLTTYLVTIASQLDLRSPSAIRLISDFLSEEDAQHLVHEISTFARSPFTSLEGYDRFVQYGRPQRRLEEEEEAAEEGGSMSRGVSDRPRFEEHMSGSRGARGGEEEQEWERERRSSAGRPPFPSSTGRDSTSGNYRSGGSPSPPSAPLPRRYSSSGDAPNGRPPPPPASNPRHRQPYRPVEPNWRERDQRYTGSYYATAASESRRGDGGNGGGRRGRRGGFVDGSTASRMRGRGGGGGPASSAVYEEDGGGGRRRYESRGRRKSPSLSLALPTRDSMSPPPPRRRRRRYSADDNDDDDDDDDDGRPSRRRFSPAPLPRSYKDERETSPLPTSETRVQGPSRSPPSPRSRSPARPRSRSRSRSKTPLQRPEPLSPLPSPPPPPPPPAAGAAGGGPAIDSELDDAISLVGPSFSIGPGSSKSNNSPLPSPLTATPAGPPPPPTSSRERLMSSSSTFDTSAPPLPPPPRGKPTLTIFGAARRLLGNGRVVTLARDGRASLQAQSDVFRNAGASASYGRGGAAGANSRPRQQESCYNQATPNRPTASSSSSSPAASAMLGPPRKPLLGRLGGIVPPPISTSSTAPVPSASSRDAAASPTTPTSSKATSPADSLRARLHARLTAEYRQALAASSRSATLPPVFEDPDGAVPPATTTTTTTTNKSDLRSLLQARLQAEKALASEDLVRTRTAASLASARDAHERVNEPTVFSQETRDLLMARLDEERRFVDEEAQAGRPASSTSASAFDTYEYGHDLAYDDGYYDYNPSYRTPAVFMDDHAAAELAPNEKDLVASSPSSSSAALAPASVTPSTSESSLKAALLAKRRAAIQDELKKFSGQLKEKEMRQKLMMQKRRSGTTAGGGGGGGGDASAEAQRAGP